MLRLAELLRCLLVELQGLKVGPILNGLGDEGLGIRRKRRQWAGIVDELKVHQLVVTQHGAQRSLRSIEIVLCVESQQFRLREVDLGEAQIQV